MLFLENKRSFYKNNRINPFMIVKSNNYFGLEAGLFENQHVHTYSAKSTTRS